MEDKNKFLILYGLFALVSFCCAILLYSTNAMVNEYKVAYIECMDAYTMAENGRLPLWDGTALNISGGLNDNSSS